MFDPMNRLCRSCRAFFILNPAEPFCPNCGCNEPLKYELNGLIKKYNYMHSMSKSENFTDGSKLTTRGREWLTCARVIGAVCALIQYIFYGGIVWAYGVGEKAGGCFGFLTGIIFAVAGLPIAAAYGILCSWVVFWLIIALTGLYAYMLLNRMQSSNEENHINSQKQLSITKKSRQQDLDVLYSVINDVNDEEKESARKTASQDISTVEHDIALVDFRLLNIAKLTIENKYMYFKYLHKNGYSKDLSLAESFNQTHKELDGILQKYKCIPFIDKANEGIKHVSEVSVECLRATHKILLDLEANEIQSKFKSCLQLSYPVNDVSVDEYLTRKKALEDAIIWFTNKIWLYASSAPIHRYGSTRVTLGNIRWNELETGNLVKWIEAIKLHFSSSCHDLHNRAFEKAMRDAGKRADMPIKSASEIKHELNFEHFLAQERAYEEALDELLKEEPNEAVFQGLMAQAQAHDEIMRVYTQIDQESNDVLRIKNRGIT